MGWKEKGITFCHRKIPYEASTTHFCYIGATGSGKTVNIRLLMQSVLPDIGSGHGVRALVYDAKRDMIPILRGMISAQKHEEVIVPLNPFDKRSYAWNMAADVKEPSNALEIASILVPPEPNASQPFFGDAVRHLLEGVLTCFLVRAQKTGKADWTFRDVMNAMWSREELVSVLRSTKETEELVPLYFSHERTSENIMSEVATKLGRYRIIASLWHHAKQEGREISLADWLNKDKERILVLGNDHTNRVAVDAINKVIFKRVTELILDQEDIDLQRNPRRIWVFLDEFVRAGKLEGAVELTTEGRSKGAAVVLGFQDINGLRAVYGKEVAEEIIGQCSNFAVLRLQSPDTAEWASRFFGNYRGIEEAMSQSWGTSHSPQGSSTQSGTNINHQLMERSAILSSQFMLLPPIGPSGDVGIIGYFFSPYYPFEGARHYKDAWEDIFGKRNEQGVIIKKGDLWDKDEAVPGIMRRSSWQQFLSRWEKDDYERVGVRYSERRAELKKLKSVAKVREESIIELAELARYRTLTTEEEKEVASFSKNERSLFVKQSGGNSENSQEGDNAREQTMPEHDEATKARKRVVGIRKVARNKKE